MRKLLFIISLLFPFISIGQIIDDFTDDDFSSNPVWYGNVNLFEIIDPPTIGDGSIAVTALDDGHVLRTLACHGEK